MSASAEVSNTDTIWFVSDIHLYHGGDEYLGQFIEFLREAADAANELWIVGDLFEFWIGPRQGSLPFYAPLLREFRALVESGTRLRVIHGNRDFLIGRALIDAGAELLRDEETLRTAEGVLHISHGDQFCIGDRSYQLARKVMRSRPMRFIASLLPVGIGLSLARRYRRISERKKRRSVVRGGGSRFYTIEEGVRQLIQTKPIDMVLCGHIHDFADRKMEVGDRQCRVVTTGAWEEGPNYAVLNGDGLCLHRFEPAAKPAAPLV